MSNFSAPFNLLDVIRKTLMAIGVFLFLSLLAQSGTQAQDPSAVRGIDESKPAQTSVVLFSR